MAEKEYIEREAVRQMINELANEPQYWHNGETYYAGVSAVDMELCEIPTVDVVEVKHGRWKLHKDGSGTCDQCGRTQRGVWDYDNWQNYCGCCGVKMTEVV